MRKGPLTLRQPNQHTMYVEAFTHAKDPAAPQTNEDRWLVHDSRLFAVIDGVTDKSGAPLPDGTTRGQAAGALLDDRLRAVPNSLLTSTSTAELLAHLTEALTSAYARLGIVDAVLAAPNLRFAAQLAVAFSSPSAWRIVVVGDCGVRVTRRGGSPVVLGSTTPHDDITAIWRAAVVEHVLAATSSIDLALTVGRAYALAGIRTFLPEYAGTFDREQHANLSAAALQSAVAAHPSLSAADVGTVLALGITGLGQHRNAPGPLGFPCLDGTDVPAETVQDITFDASEVESIELFTDGYFGLPPAGEASVAAWERHFAHVENTDPHKIGPYRSTKGSGGGKFTDDRTVLIVRPQARQEAGA